jgi:hypothetical protein
MGRCKLSHRDLSVRAELPLSLGTTVAFPTRQTLLQRRPAAGVASGHFCPLLHRISGVKRALGTETSKSMFLPKVQRDFGWMSICSGGL